MIRLPIILKDGLREATDEVLGELSQVYFKTVDDDAEVNLIALFLNKTTAIVKIIPRIKQIINIRSNATALGNNCSALCTVTGTKNDCIIAPDIIGPIAPPIILIEFEPIPGQKRKIKTYNDKMILVENSIKKAIELKVHSHPSSQLLTYVVEGRLLININGKEAIFGEVYSLGLLIEFAVGVSALPTNKR